MTGHPVERTHAGGRKWMGERTDRFDAKWNYVVVPILVEGIFENRGERVETAESDRRKSGWPALANATNFFLPLVLFYLTFDFFSTLFDVAPDNGRYARVTFSLFGFISFGKKRKPALLHFDGDTCNEWKISPRAMLRSNVYVLSDAAKKKYHPVQMIPNSVGETEQFE